MEIKSISDIPGAFFYPLKEWAEASSTNWNIFVGIPMVLLLVAAIAYIRLIKTIGEPDERTNQYHKHWAYVVLITILVCDIIFPIEYLVMQFFVYKYALAVLVFCKTFLHNIAKKKYTPLRLKFFSDYFGLDRAFLSRKLSPVKLKMCA